MFSVVAEFENSAASQKFHNFRYRIEAVRAQSARPRLPTRERDPRTWPGTVLGIGLPSPVATLTSIACCDLRTNWPKDHRALWGHPSTRLRLGHHVPPGALLHAAAFSVSVQRSPGEALACANCRSPSLADVRAAKRRASGGRRALGSSRCDELLPTCGVGPGGTGPDCRCPAS